MNDGSLPGTVGEVFKALFSLLILGWVLVFAGVALGLAAFGVWVLG